jgi:hypothetical protein
MPISRTVGRRPPALQCWSAVLDRCIARPFPLVGRIRTGPVPARASTSSSSGQLMHVHLVCSEGSGFEKPGTIFMAIAYSPHGRSLSKHYTLFQLSLIAVVFKTSS